MIDKNIWGTVCECGNEVFDYYDEHPWCEDKTIVKTVKCSNCGKINNIMIDKAEEYYNRKIFDCFSNLYGNILEIGCGGGLITEYVRGLEKVKYLVTLDIDDESISKISDKHFKLDLNSFDEYIFKIKFDFIICRDVLMYLKDIDYTFSKLSRISDKIVLLNWYDVDHKNCFNKTPPLGVLKTLKKYYKHLTIEYPYFYKKGYLIKTNSEKLS